MNPEKLAMTFKTASERYEFRCKMGLIPMRKGDGQVYFILCLSEEPLIKIGFSKQVKKRMAQMQTGSPYRHVLMGVINGGSKELEREIHKDLAALRVRGEWFRVGPAMDKWLVEVCPIEADERVMNGELPELTRVHLSKAGEGRYRLEDKDSGVLYGEYATEYLAQAALDQFDGIPRGEAYLKQMGVSRPEVTR